MARTPKAGDEPKGTRRVARDRDGVENIEKLPPSFTFKRRDHADSDRREADAIVAALQTRPGEDAMVKRFQKEGRAAAYADFLRAHGEGVDGWALDVHATDYEVFANATQVNQLPGLPGGATGMEPTS